MGENNRIVELRLAAFTLLLLTFLSGTLFAATCGANSYAQSCSQCTFDASGKMDNQCYDDYTNQGKACTFASDPVAAAKYNEGKCPGIQRCINQLETCKASASTGNDQNDCNSGKVATCFRNADMCFDIESSNCHDITPQDIGNLLCPFTPLGLILIFGFAAYSRKK